MVTPVNQDIPQTLVDTVALVARIGRNDRDIQSRFRRMRDGLQRGVADASEDEIALYRPELSKVVADIDKCLNNVQGAAAMLSQLRADAALMEARFDQVEKLVRSVAATRRKLSERAAAARQLDADAEAAVAVIRKGSLSAEADLGALKDQVAGLMKTIAQVGRESAKLEDAARKAHARRDPRALSDARHKLVDLLKYGAAAITLRPRIEAYAKQYPDIDSRVKTQLQWLLDDVQRAVDCIREVDEMAKALETQLDNLDTVRNRQPIDL